MRTVVFSLPGRNATTWGTVAALERQNPGEALWLYRSQARPAIAPFYDVLHEVRGDLLFLEDDIRTARNFIAFVARSRPRHVTSFFHTKRPTLGTPVPAVDFSFAQAVWFPAAIIKRMLKAPRRAHGGGHDDEIGFALQTIDEPVVFHRSLVQHVGEQSVSWGDRTLDHRVARDFPGEDFDCLSLL